MAPQTLDQSDGETVFGPDQIDKPVTKRKGIVGLMEKISSCRSLPKLKLKLCREPWQHALK